jgi:hypothetical protein
VKHITKMRPQPRGSIVQGSRFVGLYLSSGSDTFVLFCLILNETG